MTLWKKSKILIISHFHLAILLLKSLQWLLIAYSIQFRLLRWHFRPSTGNPTSPFLFLSLIVLLHSPFRSVMLANSPPSRFHVSFPVEHIPSLALPFITHLCKCNFPQLSSKCYLLPEVSLLLNYQDFMILSSMRTDLHSCFPLFWILHCLVSILNKYLWID